MKVTKAVSPAFEDYIFDWDYETYLTIGGYGSGKSYHNAFKIILKLLEEKRKALVVREVYDTIQESCYDLFVEILSDMNMFTDDYNMWRKKKTKVLGLKSPLRFKFPNGSQIIFRGMDKPTKVKSINGVSIVWLEECSEIKYDGYKELLGRIRTPNVSMHFILSCNPVGRENWIYQHFFKHTDDNGETKVILDESKFYEKKVIVKNGVYYHHSIPEDNTFLQLSYIQKLEELKTYDPDLYRVARKGRFGTNGKKVLPQFVIADNPRQFKAAVNACSKKRNGFDFGFETSYNALVRVAVDTKNCILYIYDEWYRNKLTDKESADKIKEWNPDSVNWLIKADCAQPGSIKYFRDEGFRFTKCHKITRLEQVKKVKRFKKIICSPKCKNTIRELKDLTYKEDSNGNLIYDEFNRDPHTFSAIWYALDDVSVANIKERKNNSKRGVS